MANVSSSSSAWGDPATVCTNCGQQYYGTMHNCITTTVGAGTANTKWVIPADDSAEKMREVVKDAIEHVFEEQAQEHYKTATFSDLETIMAMIKAVVRNLETYMSENGLDFPDMKFHLKELVVELEDYYGS